MKHSKAVDYPKSGVPVLEKELKELTPRRDEPKPDFLERSRRKAAKRNKVLSLFFQNVDSSLKGKGKEMDRLSVRSLDPLNKLSKLIAESENLKFPPSASGSSVEWKAFEKFMRSFSDQLRRIARHAGGISGVEVSEPEIFLGVVRGRDGDGLGRGPAASEQLERMKVETRALFDGVRQHLHGNIEKSWQAWCTAVDLGKGGMGPWGIRAFGWLALGVLLEALEAQGNLVI